MKKASADGMMKAIATQMTFFVEKLLQHPHNVSRKKWTFFLTQKQIPAKATYPWDRFGQIVKLLDGDFILLLPPAFTVVRFLIRSLSSILSSGRCCWGGCSCLRFGHGDGWMALRTVYSAMNVVRVCGCGCECDRLTSVAAVVLLATVWYPMYLLANCKCKADYRPASS
jgi:hypothetical protein